MFQIQISGLHDSVRLREEWATKTIGLFDPDDHRRPPDSGTYHQECFFDLEDLAGPQPAPSRDAIARILEFASRFQRDDRILVHCVAGVSRSTAVAILVLIRHGMAPERAFSHISKIRPAMSPNMLILEHGEALLRLNGAIKRAYLGWHRAALTGSGALASGIAQASPPAQASPHA